MSSSTERKSENKTTSTKSTGTSKKKATTKKGNGNGNGGKSSSKKANDRPKHKPYKILIAEAITAMQNRKGSSRHAIKKFIQDNHEGELVQSAFDTAVSRALKLGVQSGELVQVGQSFRLSPQGRTKLAKKTTRVTAAKKRGTGSASNKGQSQRKKSRPLRKWVREELQEAKGGEMKFAELRDAIKTKRGIKSTEVEQLERSLKAVMTRGVADKVFIKLGDDSYRAVSDSSSSNSEASS